MSRGRKPGFVMSDEHRTKISNSKILNRLVDHVEGKCDLSATQVTAAVALLKKVMPDLQAVEMSGEQTVTYAISPNLPTEAEWESENATAH